MTPLPEPTFLVLSALAGETLHGYGILQAVAELSGDRVQMLAGTLYPALDRLTRAELIELDREEVVDGRLRRYYRLTDAGATRLAEDIERQRSNVAAATTRLATRASRVDRYRAPRASDRRGPRVAPA